MRNSLNKLFLYIVKITCYTDDILSTLVFSFKSWKPVSFLPQVSMVDAIPGLINAIRMIHTISRYYSISENIRSLFVKVAMFSYCKYYYIFNWCFFFFFNQCKNICRWRTRWSQLARTISLTMEQIQYGISLSKLLWTKSMPRSTWTKWVMILRFCSCRNCCA